MRKETGIVSYSTDELREMVKQGKSLADWDRVRAMTDEEVEAAIASDPDEAGMVIDWSSASATMPANKESMTIRLDRDVLEFFRGLGRGYQTRINAVLRTYMDHSTREGSGPTPSSEDRRGR